MPFIETKTTKEISPMAEAEIRKRLGSDIEIFKGKSERWLMLDFHGGRRMSFQGLSEPDCAMVSVALFGSAAKSEYDSFTRAVTNTVSEVLDIPADRIYVKYTEHSIWGFDGENF